MTDMRAQQQQRNLGRAQNAIQDYLIRKLVVPKVYLDAEWDGSGTPVRVLAIDRAGVGDVHAAWIVQLDPGIPDDAAFVDFASKTADVMEKYKTHLSHYRYAVVVNDRPYAPEFNPGDGLKEISFAEDGVGRFGILYVDLSEDDPSVKVTLKAERFRSSKEIVELADRYVAEHTANSEIRDEPASIS